ncbi:MAG: aminotransferase class I/II-fold pyridoxal phosphate-dependent enzyme [Promethearchaeota archaeon]
MRISPFKLERYFAKYEFSAKYLLSSSDCESLTQQEVLALADEETRNLWDNLKLSYTESRGLPLLRDEIAKIYRYATADDILVTVPEEGIFITLNCLLKKEDHIICTYPGYQSLYEIAQTLGCEVTKWIPDEEANWQFDPEFLVNNIKSNSKLIICNFPHNPTGYLPSKEDFEHIINIAKEHDLYVFSDEMYRFLELDPNNRLPSATDIYDKTISLFGMSKTFGMPGIRLGWVVTKDKDLYQQMSAFKDYTTICSSGPSEILALIGLRAREEIVKKQLKRIIRNLKLLDVFFETYAELFAWVRPKAGSICFPRLLIDHSSSDFCENIIKKTGIMLLPSAVYEYDEQHFRIGFGKENMPEALIKLGKYLNKEYYEIMR